MPKCLFFGLPVDQKGWLGVHSKEDTPWPFRTIVSEILEPVRRQYEGARWEAWRTAHNQIGLPFIWVPVDFRNIPEIGNIRVMVLQDG